ncbi:MAG: hypothetical protein JOZ62_16650 [Acidobacteriaceae bacterium]|nr:hypothetical protein [Acidobacteriaceae bacterium]
MTLRYLPPYRRERAWLAPQPLLYALQARWRLLLGSSATLFTIGLALILLLPKKFESHMKLLVKSESERIVSPTQRNINSEIQVLKSSDVLRKVVLKTGLQKLEFGASDSVGETSSLTIEKAVRRLKDDLKTSAIKDSNVIEVAYAAASPDTAAAVLRQLADAYVEIHGEARPAKGNLKFLQHQSVFWSQGLQRAEEDLVNFRKAYSTLVLPGEREAFAKRAVEAQAAFEQADAQVAQCRRKVSAAREKLQRLRTTAATRSEAQVDSGNRAHGTIMLAGFKERAARFIPRLWRADHRVREENQQTEKTERAFASVSTDAGDNQITVINQVQQTAESDLVDAEVELAGLQDLRDRLKNIAERYRKGVDQLASAAIKHDALLREVKQSEDRYLLYSRKQEEARIAQSVAADEVSNVTVAESPAIPAQPSTPDVGTDVTVAAVLSFCFGALFVVTVEFLSPSALLTYAAYSAVRRTET